MSKHCWNLKIKNMDNQDVLQRVTSLVDSFEYNSRSDFAKVVGLDPSGFRKKLKGEGVFTKMDINRICGATGINEEWLAYGKGPMRVGEEQHQKIAVAYDFLKQENDFLREMLEMKDETISTLQKCVSLFEKILDTQTKD